MTTIMCKSSMPNFVKVSRAMALVLSILHIESKSDVSLPIFNFNNNKD